jgi:hypothetical protein
LEEESTEIEWMNLGEQEYCYNWLDLEIEMDLVESHYFVLEY